MAILKITTMGTSTGVVLPEEILARLKVGTGDTLLAIESPGGYLITRYDPETERQLKLGAEILDEYRETLRALAK